MSDDLLERARTIAWLREKVEPCKRTGEDWAKRCDDDAAIAWFTRAETYAFAADQIEAGIHLTARDEEYPELPRLTLGRIE